MCILCVDSGRDRDGDGGDDDHDDDGNNGNGDDNHDDHEDLQAASIIIMLSVAALHNLIHLTT